MVAPAELATRMVRELWTLVAGGILLFCTKRSNLASLGP